MSVLLTNDLMLRGQLRRLIAILDETVSDAKMNWEMLRKVRRKNESFDKSIQFNNCNH